MLLMGSILLLAGLLGTLPVSAAPAVAELGVLNPDPREKPEPRQGGETIEDAVEIEVPFGAFSGCTCGHVNDYDEECPYGNSVAPDVVYRFTSPGAGQLMLDLCTSQYDTKIYVYDFDAGYGFQNPFACNDDWSCGDLPYRSRIDGVNVGIGHTYYVVIDGYDSSCGEYVLYLDWL